MAAGAAREDCTGPGGWGFRPARERGCGHRTSLQPRWGVRV